MSFLDSLKGNVSSTASAAGAGSLVTSAIGSAAGALGLSGLVSFVGRADPDTTCQFELEMGGVIQTMAFREATGLKVTQKVSSAIREGGNNMHPHYMLEGLEWEPLVLKKGWFASSTEFFDWLIGAHHSSEAFTRSNISIIARSLKGTELCRFELHKCFMLEYDGPKFDAMAKDIAFETIKIRYDYFTFQPSSGLEKLAGDLLGSGMAAATGALGGYI